MKIKKHIPNTLTFFNLIMGCTVISYAGEISECKYVLLAFPLAMLFDLLDGYFARRLGVDSEIGLNLDSLADIVSFGVAPFVVLLAFYGHSFANFIVFLPVVLAGAYRLARFNVNPTTHSDKPYYQGLPIPFTAIVIPIIIIWELPLVAAIVIILLHSGLMISKLKIKKYFA